MKFIFSLLFGLAIPAFASTETGNLLNGNKISSEKSRPYVIEEFDAKGNKVSEIKGISGKTDPFLISKEVGANPYGEDRYSIFPDIRMGIGGKITLYRAPDYQIRDGKKNYTVRSWTKTVGNLLAENKIELGQDDKINFSKDTPLELGMNITIIRVAKTTVIESEPIDYEIIKKEDPNLEKGNKRIEQKGKDGQKNLYYEVTREDGVEISRVLKKSEVASEPIPEKVTVGTKVVSYGSGVASIWKESGDMVAACNFVSRGTMVHVVNLDNKKSVDVTCMGGGLRSDRIVDLSDVAFEKLGGTWSQGLLKNIRVEKYYPSQ